MGEAVIQLERHDRLFSRLRTVLQPNAPALLRANLVWVRTREGKAPLGYISSFY